MPDAFTEFLAAPSGESFLRLRAEVMAHDEYEFGSDELAELEALVAVEAHDAVPDKLASMMPAWLLSPRAHLLSAFSAQHRGDTDRAAAERAFAQACVLGLRASGDGSAARPFRVTHVDDEYDLLDILGRRVISHRQHAREDGVFDRLRCDDGSELWFDITGALR